MPPSRRPTAALDEIGSRARVILVDMHAEATSEKKGIGWHLDGRVSAVVGTHTHVATADEEILPQGTAYVTDLGMTGPHRSVLGRRVEDVLARFRTNKPQRLEVAEDDVRSTGVTIDVDDATGARHRDPASRAAMSPEIDRPLTITEITGDIRMMLEETFTRVWLVGEVSNLRRPASGHLYLTLKDDGAQISAVVWRSTVARLRAQPENGMQVVVRGRITVYPPRGDYQIVVDGLQPQGVGALEEAFRRLCAKLEAEGLFDADRKRPLPFLPRRVAIVTSPTGAALHDVKQVILRRFPPADLLVVPVRVQGEGAAAEIAAAIERVNADPRGCEVIIVGRGGGSLEDLWASQRGGRRAGDLRVAPARDLGRRPRDRRVRRGPRRRPTRADAERGGGDRAAAARSAARDARRREGTAARRGRALARAPAPRDVEDRRRRLRGRSPTRAIAERAQRIDELAERAGRSARAAITTERRSLAAAAGRRDALSPLRVLGRGYSITTRDGASSPLRDADDVAAGDRISTRLASGTILSEVVETKADDD